MTTKDYCYNLKGIKNDDPSIKPIIIKHLEKLFQNKKKFGENAFDATEKLPIDIGIPLVWKNYKQACLDIKSKSQVAKKRIKKILKMIKDEDLIIDKEKGISLQKPDLVCEVKEYDGKQRWTTLEHNGPYFKHLFEPSVERLNVNLIYDGKEYSLNAKEEEVASFYAKRIITEEKSTKKYLSMKEFNDNFFNDFKTYLTSEHKKIFKDFKKINFSLLVNRIKEIKQEKENEKKLRREQKEKDKKKDKKDEEDEKHKKEERIAKLEKKLNYSFAFVDGIKKDIRNSAVEMPGLYVGAGNVMKYKGRIKPLYYPEDVIINVSKGKAPLPPKGHKWGGIITDNEANWISNYKDKVTGKRKYIFLTETRDLLKFEKARKLNKYINVVNKQINDLLHNKNKKEKQIGCALYLIKEYGIRVGNECEEDDDSCDTKEKVVGATTLMVQNVKCVENEEDDKFFIDLSFKGKDSVSYDNTLEVSEDVYKNIKTFIKGKSEDSKVFDLISSNDVNKYLKSIDKDFSAKVFRTRLASSIMYEGLKKTSYTKKDTDDKKIADFNEINRRVAIKLNHKKGLTDAVKEKLIKDKEEIEKKKKEIKQEKDPKKKEKLKSEIKIKEAKLLEKDKSKEIALDTSKKNYIYPRIIKAWAERVNLGGCKDEEEEEEEEENEDDEEETVIKHCVDKVYTTAHIKHFKWAIEDDKFDEDWDYEDTELDCSVGTELKPEEDKEDKVNLIKKMDINSEHVQKCIQKVAIKFNKTKKEVIKVFNDLKK